MTENELYIQNGLATSIKSNSTNKTITIDVIPEALCAPNTSGNSPLIISYGTDDPSTSTPGMIYIKYKAWG